MTAELFTVIVLMGLVAFACKAGGFWAMRYVSLTPRAQSALAAVPMASLGAIVAPAALAGGVAEWLALVAAALAMRLVGNDIAATAIGLAVLLILHGFAG